MFGICSLYSTRLKLLPIKTANAILFSIISSKVSTNIFFALQISAICNRIRVRVIVFNATFNNISAISWWLDLLVEEVRLHRENYRPDTSY